MSTFEKSVNLTQVDRLLGLRLIRQLRSKKAQKWPASPLDRGACSQRGKKVSLSEGWCLCTCHDLVVRGLSTTFYYGRERFVTALYGPFWGT